jgi:RNA polymerase sigma-70 factor (ECF subfamily)
MAPVWQQAFEQIRGEQIAAALAALPPEQRETIELAYFGGKSQSEIAELQGIPLGTVKGRTRLALEKLRGLLVGLREEPA